MPPQLHKACRRAACRTSFAAAQSFELASSTFIKKPFLVFLHTCAGYGRVTTSSGHRATARLAAASVLVSLRVARTAGAWRAHAAVHAEAARARGGASDQRVHKAALPRRTRASALQQAQDPPPHPRRARCYSPQYACLTPLRALRRRSRRPCRATSSRGSTCRRFWRPTVIRRASPGNASRPWNHRFIPGHACPALTHRS